MTNRDAQRRPLRRLAESIERYAVEEGWNDTPFEPLRVFRADTPVARTAELVSRPSLCLVAQGVKRGFTDSGPYRYDVATYAVITRPMEIEAEILEASPKRPFLSIGLALGAETVADVLQEMGSLRQQDTEPVWLDPVERPILDAVQRLLDSVHKRDERLILAPLVVREVAFRVLVGRQGSRLAAASRKSVAYQPILQAIRQIHESYSEPLRIPMLAKDVGMSSSLFHRRFKDSTGTTPGRYLRRLRLEQGRRLIEVLGLDVGEAAFRVGYGDPSRFSRDFRQRWGQRPSELGRI